MGKLSTLIVATAFLALGSAAAQAQGAAASMNKGVQSFTPIHRAACQGPGPYCGPGYVRQCGPWRCWCRPCY